MSDAALDAREQLLRIDRAIADIERAQAETRKFVAEREKLTAEAGKLRRDRPLAPALAITGLIGGLITIAGFVTQYVLHAQGGH